MATTLIFEALPAVPAERGVALSKDESRTHVYGMPYEEWKDHHQREASPSQLADFEKSKPGH